MKCMLQRPNRPTGSHLPENRYFIVLYFTYLTQNMNVFQKETNCLKAHCLPQSSSDCTLCKVGAMPFLQIQVSNIANIYVCFVYLSYMFPTYIKMGLFYFNGHLQGIFVMPEACEWGSCLTCSLCLPSQIYGHRMVMEHLAGVPWNHHLPAVGVRAVYWRDMWLLCRLAALTPQSLSTDNAESTLLPVRPKAVSNEHLAPFCKCHTVVLLASNMPG